METITYQTDTKWFRETFLSPYDSTRITVKTGDTYQTKPYTLDSKQLFKHFAESDYSIGVYWRSECSFLTVDFDSHSQSFDDLQRAETRLIKFATALYELTGYYPICERSKKNRGFHATVPLEPHTHTWNAEKFTLYILDQAGLSDEISPGVIEIFPKGKKSVRLPLASDYQLINPLNNYSPLYLDPNEAIEYLKECQALEFYPTALRISEYLKTVPKKRSGKREKRLRLIRDRNKDDFEVRRILNEGLTEFGTRRIVQAKLVNYYIKSGESLEDTKDRILNFLKYNHNHKSHEINEGNWKQVESDIDHLINTFKVFPSKKLLCPVHSPKLSNEALLLAAQLLTLISQGILKPYVTKYNGTEIRIQRLNGFLHVVIPLKSSLIHKKRLIGFKDRRTSIKPYLSELRINRIITDIEQLDLYSFAQNWTAVNIQLLTGISTVKDLINIKDHLPSSDQALRWIKEMKQHYSWTELGRILDRDPEQVRQWIKRESIKPVDAVWIALKYV